LTIPNGVTSIGNSVFENCSGFTGGLTIPNGVTTIGSYAFFGCSGFTGGLTIPNSVTTINTGAFNGCSQITAISTSYATTPSFSGSNSFANMAASGTVTNVGVSSAEVLSFLKTKSLPDG
jgi:hypothetical protein